MYSIPRNCLKAALVCSAKADVRYYLNGVLFTVNINRQAALVSTDGNRLFAGLLPDTSFDGAPINAPLDLIIPRDVVAKESKSNPINALLRHLNDEQWILGETLFTPVNAKFPDWRKVTPSAYACSGGAGQFNPDYLADAQLALRTWDGSKKKRFYPLIHNGKKAALMCADTAYVVIMPRNMDKVNISTPFAWNNAPIKMPEAIAA